MCHEKSPLVGLICFEAMICSEFFDMYLKFYINIIYFSKLKIFLQSKFFLKNAWEVRDTQKLD